MTFFTKFLEFLHFESKKLEKFHSNKKMKFPNFYPLNTASFGCLKI